MHRSKAEELGALESGNHAEHTLLVADTKTSLKTNDVPHASAAVFLPQLHHRVRLARGPRIPESNRFERAESKRVPSASRHLLDRHAALEVRHRIEIVRTVLVRRGERVDEVRVLLAVERAVEICAVRSGIAHRLLTVARRAKRHLMIDRVSIDDGSDRIVERECFDAESRPDRLGEHVRSEWTGCDDSRRWQVRDFPAFDRYARRRCDVFSHRSRENNPIDGQGSETGGAGLVSCPKKE